MRRTYSLSFLVTTWLMLTLPVISGCFGVMQRKPFECFNDTPHTERRHTTDVPWMTSLTSTVPLTKEDYSRAWGEPASKEVNGKGELWIYKDNHLWCGVAVVVFVVGIPLLLPVCDEFERIQFEGHMAKSVHSKVVLWQGVYIDSLSFKSSVVKQSACLKPLPYSTDWIKANTSTMIRLLKDKQYDGHERLYTADDILHHRSSAGDYVLIKDDDIVRINAEVLRIAIYARHGRMFSTPEMKRILKDVPWYHPRADFKESELNDFEQKNVDFILEFENKNSWK
jgi:hypothetical protein